MRSAGTQADADPARLSAGPGTRRECLAAGYFSTLGHTARRFRFPPEHPLHSPRERLKSEELSPALNALNFAVRCLQMLLCLNHPVASENAHIGIALFLSSIFSFSISSGWCCDKLSNESPRGLYGRAFEILISRPLRPPRFFMVFGPSWGVLM